MENRRTTAATADQKRISFFKKLCMVSAGICVFSIFLQAYISNSSGVKGKELEELYVRKTALEKEIAALEFEITSLSSLSYVEEAAREIGFVNMDKSFSVVQPISVAALLANR